MCHGNCENCRAYDRCFPSNEEKEDDISRSLKIETEQILDTEFWESYSWWSTLECKEFERSAIA